jgi:hypothetical protein
VLRLILRVTLRLVVIGVVVGLLGSLGVMKVLASQVWGVSPRDPVNPDDGCRRDVGGGAGRQLFPRQARDEREPDHGIAGGVERIERILFTLGP